MPENAHLLRSGPNHHNIFLLVRILRGAIGGLLVGGRAGRGAIGAGQSGRGEEDDCDDDLKSVTSVYLLLDKSCSVV